MARYDFGMTLSEFGRTTPGMFAELIKRQGARFRRDCYLAGVTASSVWNVNRTTDKAKIWSPFDFVAETEKRTSKRDELKKKIMSIFGAMMEFNNSPASMDRAREQIVAKLTRAGYSDVEEVFEEAFPHWEKRKP